jgi:predicted kinase
VIEESTVHIMIGLPGSGKSGLARSLDAVRFSLDDYRSMMGRDGWDEALEKLAQRSMIDGVVRAVDDGWDVVIDNTHLGRFLPDRYRRALAMRPVTFRENDLTGVPVEDCVRRDGKRTGDARVGEKVIHDMWGRNESLRASGWRLTDEWMNQWRDIIRPLQPFVRTEGLPDCVVFDIDGTLAIHDGRGPYDLSRLGGDLLNQSAAAAMRAYIAAGIQIVLLSGRQAEYRTQTSDWLEKVMPREMLQADPPLHMRPIGDNRPDFIVKAQLFEENIRGVYNVIAMYDDRDQVVELWRRIYKLPCHQVAYGAF